MDGACEQSRWEPKLDLVVEDPIECPTEHTNNHHHRQRGGLPEKEGSYDREGLLFPKKTFDQKNRPFTEVTGTNHYGNHVDPKGWTSVLNKIGPDSTVKLALETEMNFTNHCETKLHDGCTSCGHRGTQCQDTMTTTPTSAMTTVAMWILILVVVVVSIFVAVAVVTLSNSHAHLLDRVSSLENALSELSASCNLHCGPERTQGQDGIARGERRSNKFAFLMTHNTLPGLSDTDLGHAGSQIEGTGDLVADEISSRTHPTKRAGMEKDSVMTMLSKTDSTQDGNKQLGGWRQHVEVKDPSTLLPSAPNPSNGNDTEQNMNPMVHRVLRDLIEERERRRVTGRKGNRPRGVQRQRAGDDVDEEGQSSQTRRHGPRARTSILHSDRNSSSSPVEEDDETRHVIRGVHFQGNLNRTAIIGVGWMPHWALSTSLFADRGVRAAVQRKFRLSARGNVTVVDAGLYYIYSQMMYYDSREYVGHSIAIDGVEAFTCIAQVAHQPNTYKTCFIGGLAYLHESTKVGVKMMYTPQKVSLFEDTSYFGMFQVT